MQLRRITTHGNWIPEVDSLRFIAIVSTLFTHILGETVIQGRWVLSPDSHKLFNEVMYRGGRGVPLFFAISGFILAQPFLRHHLLHGEAVSVRRFYRRRLTRLEPPYILSLLIYTTALHVHHPLHMLIEPLLAHIFYVHNFTHLMQLNFVTWSLEVEVQFYLLAPLFGYLYAISSTAKRRGILLAILLASATLQRLLPGIAATSLPGQLQFFLVGFLVADLRATRTSSTIKPWWDIVGFVAWIAIFAIPNRYISFSLPLLMLPAYLSAFNGPITRRFFQTRWVALTGGMCYSFYLMHILVITMAFKVTRRLIVPSSIPISFLLQVVPLGICIFFFCTAYFVFIERPCMDPNWPRKLAARFVKARQVVFTS
ncbi:acyltransferase [Granulicella mallensis]|uniref:Peptidoglycan/LPS O-acetylase OafA/YrhL n=1 Tax=Granulicella mallensis TaxID=940614 RepID=A0A7W7ZRE7_9BACT|nr:acyltransferase [Granulicella mallensis]MBB5064755.1 peptidoglycan/LPS O-acetylase OafA/YrhL [Granulicella mallensis]